MGIEDDELERYATILGRVSVGTPLGEVLGELGLDEVGFDALEARIERELSLALAAAGDSPAPFVVRYERAIREGQVRATATQGHAVMPFERFAQALAALGSGANPVEQLEQLGVKPADLARAASAHAASLARDPELVEALERALAKRRG
jgi:hypothetical protein